MRPARVPAMGAMRTTIPAVSLAVAAVLNIIPVPARGTLALWIRVAPIPIRTAITPARVVRPTTPALAPVIPAWRIRRVPIQIRVAVDFALCRLSHIILVPVVPAKQAQPARAPVTVAMQETKHATIPAAAVVRPITLARRDVALSIRPARVLRRIVT